MREYPLLGSVIDLKKYKDHIHPKILNGKFVRFDIVDLNQYDPNDNELTKVDIRAKQNTAVDIDKFATQLLKNGWDYRPYPPIFHADMFKKENGISRIRALKKAGERWMPVSVYKFDANYNDKARCTNGITLNHQAFATPSTLDDVIVAAAALIKEGTLNNKDPEAVDEWFEDLQLKNFFHGNAINAVKNRILKLDEHGATAVRVFERKEALDYINKYLGYNVEQKEPVGGSRGYVYVANQLNAWRCLCEHIIPNAQSGIKTDIYLNAKAYTVEETNITVKLFRDSLIDTIGRFSHLINAETSSIVTMKYPFTSTMWEIKGVIPCKKTELHENMYKINDILKVDEFLLNN